MNLKQEKRRAQRAEFKQIESVLHPCPTVGDIEILHEHKGKKIIFTAWKDDEPCNDRFLVMQRFEVLTQERGPSQEEVEWLAGKAS